MTRDEIPPLYAQWGSTFALCLLQVLQEPREGFLEAVVAFGVRGIGDEVGFGGMGSVRLLPFSR
jgi:hypothetical protein